MKNRYRLVRRAYGIYYSLDKESGRKESLETTHKIEAEKLLSAKNDTIQQPALNKGMAKVYLSAASPEFSGNNIGGNALRFVFCRQICQRVTTILHRVHKGRHQCQGTKRGIAQK